MNSFLSYWKPATADFNLHGRTRLLNHIASQQYYRLSPGNEVYVVTVRNGSLLLLGKVVVGRIVGQDVAERYCGIELWESEYHVLAKPGTERPLRELNISKLAGRLRFVSPRDRLSVDGGRVDPKQLQSMRLLTQQSAALLDEALEQAS
jgi:hypothetical protein